MEPRTNFVVRGGITVLGRSSSADIVLKSDDFASGSHARLTRHAGLLYIEDTESTNGTYVNGKLVTEPTKVTVGDVVRIGKTLMRFEI